MKGSIKKWMGLSSLGLLAVFSTQIYGSGFKLEFQSPSVLADAGEAAVVEDAGTNWYNSAGLVYLPQQVVMGSTHVYTRTRFSGSTTAPNILGIGPTFFANGRASSHANIDLPNMHYVLPFGCNCRYAFGISVVPAWGLLQDYGDRSVVRYDLDRVYTRTLDISPSLAMKINDHWSVGAGLDRHYFYLSSNTNVRTQPVTPVDSVSRISTSDWATGGHIGVLYRMNDCTRFGLNYRTRMTMDLRGYSHFTFGTTGNFETDNFRLKFPIPAVTTFSAYHAITPKLAVMGTVSYERWSVIRNLNGINFIGPGGLLSNVTLPQHFHNTWDFGVGTHYKLNDCILLRASVKYLQTPTTNTYRDLNFPDGEKLGFNFGSRIKINPKMAVDLLYAHVFTRGVSINRTNVFGANVNGNARTAIDLAGAQLVWNI